MACGTGCYTDAFISRTIEFFAELPFSFVNRAQWNLNRRVMSCEIRQILVCEVGDDRLHKGHHSHVVPDLFQLLEQVGGLLAADFGNVRQQAVIACWPMTG